MSMSAVLCRRPDYDSGSTPAFPTPEEGDGTHDSNSSREPFLQARTVTRRARSRRPGVSTISTPWRDGERKPCCLSLLPGGRQASREQPSQRDRRVRRARGGRRFTIGETEGPTRGMTRKEKCLTGETLVSGPDENTN